MLKIMRYLLMNLFILISLISSAQEVQMADEMRNNGKIYVVVAVCLTILLGLFLYVFLVDRKISRLEKENINRK